MAKLTITPNLEKLMYDRYYQEGETTPQQMIRRVADFIAGGEKIHGYDDVFVKRLADEYFETMNDRLWIPSTPFLMNGGTNRPMVFACFVVGGVNDNLEDIYEALKRQGMINKLGGGTGFNFSRLREEGAPIKSTGGTSSGVLSFMDLFNENGGIIKQGGRRRSANMGILNYNHPDIMRFITYKTENKNKLTNFNISVLVDDEFMEKVLNREDYDLISPASGLPVGTLNAKEVYDAIIYYQHKTGDPALLFRTAMNKDNPMRAYMGDIVTTNPCGEVVLYDDEACVLASLNLEEFIDWNGTIDWAKLRYIVRLATRFLDTSIDINEYPDAKIEKAVKFLRRLGLGIMSLHGFLLKAGLTYSSKAGRHLAEKVMKFINDEAFQMSCELAQEKGVFEGWEHSDYAKKGIRVRNVARTTIAPTGTIQQILNTSSSGCEPMFAIAYKRLIDERETFWVNPFFEDFAKAKGFWNDKLPELIYNNKGSVKGIAAIPKKYQNIFETAMEIDVESHVRMQAVLQKHVDNSISKTINMPREATTKDVSDAFMLGWSLGLKGMTIYRDGSRDGQVLSVGGTDTEKEKVIDEKEALELGIINEKKLENCPQCGEKLSHEGGCTTCHSCGWGACSV